MYLYGKVIFFVPHWKQVFSKQNELLIQILNIYKEKLSVMYYSFLLGTRIVFVSKQYKNT